MRTEIGLLGLAFTLTACQRAPEPVVSEAWIRLPAVAQRPGAAYFTVKGADHDTNLLSVKTPIANRTELHETMTMTNGAMTMAPINNLSVPAGKKIEFKPGGKHVMLFDVNPQAKPGQSVKLTLSFADGKNITVEAKTVPAGSAKPKF